LGEVKRKRGRVGNSLSNKPCIFGQLLLFLLW
jgi:hypothetical protein